MINKTKSSRKNLVKYTLFLPVIISMLFYVSCETDIVDNDTANDSLDKYTYSLKKNQKMDSKTQAIHDKMEEFVISNPEYVLWAHNNPKTNVTAYSVHHIDEQPPSDYTRHQVTRENGESYTAFMKFPKKKIDIENIDPSTLELSDIEYILKDHNLTDAQRQEFEKWYLEQKKRVEQRNLQNGIYSSIQSHNLDKNEIPFGLVDQVPIFKGCEKGIPNEETKRCTAEKIASFVNKNFNSDLGKELGLKGRQRINVIFKIDEGGNVVSIRSRAPHPELEKEAIRVISLLPQFTPGKNNGETVTVPYSLPIVFQVQE